jgi:hypothetical protein
MTWPADAGASPALRHNASSDTPWGRYAWRIETGTVPGALGPLAGRRVAGRGLASDGDHRLRVERLKGVPASARTGALGISRIPALMVAGDGIVLCAQPGALPETALKQPIAKAGELDMDQSPGEHRRTRRIRTARRGMTRSVAQARGRRRP